jgi:A/G-specific adenine glycosylase
VTGGDALHGPVLAWFDTFARDLPWRRPACDAWGVLVSEVMLQQTPVVRVLPVWQQWLARWPTPADLAAEPPGEAVLHWGRLGYPRRALRLHAAAGAIMARHDGVVPAELTDLLALPGVGGYTAAAVASFAYRRRHAVLDTNVRRVLARAVTGQPQPASATPSAAEIALAERLLPDPAERAARWAAATMELGALICTARAPDCPACPLRQRCAWQSAGRPAGTGAARPAQRYQGTDRWMRGLLLAAARAASGPVSRPGLARAVPDGRQRDPRQRDRALDSLVADGLLEPLPRNRFRLPGR